MNNSTMRVIVGTSAALVTGHAVISLPGMLGGTSGLLMVGSRVALGTAKIVLVVAAAKTIA